MAVSRELILKAIDSIAAMHGWTAAKDKENIICNRFGSGRSGTRDFSAGKNLQANCSLIIKLKAKGEAGETTTTHWLWLC